MYYISAPVAGTTNPPLASVAVGKRLGQPGVDAGLDPAGLGAAVVDAAELDAVELGAAESALRVQLIDHIRVLEELKSSMCAAQARAAAVFDESSRRSQARAGVKAEQLGRGVAAQIALARRESPNKGARLLGLARILSKEMPHTLRALSSGVISEWRATILVRETSCLTLADRQKVDEQIAGDPERLAQLGDRRLIAEIKSVSYGLDPLSVVNRAAKVASERFVSCRPAPDTMTYVTALLPVTQGVGVMAALTRTADRARAAGDHRSKGQVMADTFVELLTGQARAEDLRVEVQLIMTDRTLLHGVLSAAVSGHGNAGGGDSGGSGAGNDFGGNRLADNEPASNELAGNTGGPARTVCGGPGGSAEPFVPEGAEPAVLAGYGIVPAQWARDLIRRGGAGSHAPIGSGGSLGDARDGTAGTAGNEGNEESAGNEGSARRIRRSQDRGQDAEEDSREGTHQPRPSRREPRTEVWLRRLYATPDSGRLIAMDSRARLVPVGLARLVAARDQICRTPWCGAPIRHYDHMKPFREGGPTSAENIQGLCEACNLAKEAPGWTSGCEEAPAALTGKDGTGRHTVTITTPTGHVYRSTAPPLPGSR